MNADYTSEPIEDFRLTIDALKRISKQSGNEVTNTEISKRLGISIPQLEKYYNTNDVPHNIYTLLREKFSEFLSGFGIDRVRFTDYKEAPEPPIPGEDDDEED